MSNEPMFPKRRMARMELVPDDDNFAQQITEALVRIEGGMQDVIDAVEALTDHAVSRAVVVPPPAPSGTVELSCGHATGVHLLFASGAFICSTCHADVTSELDPARAVRP